MGTGTDIINVKLYLVNEVIPPVGPRLLHTALFLDDSLLHRAAEHAERHRNTVIVIAVHADALLELRDRFPVYLQPVVQLLRLHTELCCDQRSVLAIAHHDHQTYPVRRPSP